MPTEPTNSNQQPVNPPQQVNQTQSATTAPKKKTSTTCCIIAAVVIVAFLILGVGGVYALYKFTNISLGPISSVLGPKLNPNCKYNDPDLCKFVNNWKNVDYMTMTSEEKEADGKTLKMVFKMQGDTKNQLMMEENGTENFNTIVIDKVTYSKDYSDNKWFKYTAEETDVTNGQIKKEFNFDDEVASTEDKTTYKKMGTEACGKLTCFKYEVIYSEGSDVFEFVYFDNKDYLLRKTRSEYSNGSVAESTISYDKFNLTAPSPVKDGTPFMTSTPTSTTTSIPSSSSANTSTQSVPEESSPSLEDLQQSEASEGSSVEPDYSNPAQEE